MDNQNSKFHLPKIPAIIWIQLLLLAIGYAFYSANRLSFGVGLKAIAAQLALTPIQVGTLGTIFTLGQALIDIPAGYLWTQTLACIKHGFPRYHDCYRNKS